MLLGGSGLGARGSGCKAKLTGDSAAAALPSCWRGVPTWCACLCVGVCVLVCAWGVGKGDTTTSRRLFDAVAAGCIPVIIADNVNLPFSNQVLCRQPRV